MLAIPADTAIPYWAFLRTEAWARTLSIYGKGILLVYSAQKTQPHNILYNPQQAPPHA